jgi:hypothetical protein
VSEQRRTRQFLRALVYVLAGFALGSLSIQFMWRLHL